MLEIMLEHCFSVDWMLFARIESVLRHCLYIIQILNFFEGMM